MNDLAIERRQGDEMLHMTLMDGQAKVLLCRTTAMARKAAEIHRPSSTALAATTLSKAVLDVVGEAEMQMLTSAPSNALCFMSSGKKMS